MMENNPDEVERLFRLVAASRRAANIFYSGWHLRRITSVLVSRRTPPSGPRRPVADITGRGDPVIKYRTCLIQAKKRVA